MKKNIYSYHRKISFFLFLFFLVSVLVLFSADLKNLKGDSSKYNSNGSEFPKSNANEIILLTPENKIYSNPDRGYYPATYSFENTKAGFVPKGWDEFSDDNCFCTVVDEYDGHNKVLQLYDNSDVGYCKINNTFSPKTDGIVEFYWRTSHLRTFITLYNGPKGVVYCEFVEDMHVFRTYDGVSFQNVMSGVTFNTWYYHKLEFNSSTHTFDWYIDDVLRGNNKGFWYEEDQVDRFYIGTEPGETNHYSYFDAIGYSWDPNYNIGDNRKEGLLLSFENATNLDWIGYSLNGAANKTIMGNTTIPFPSDGTHTLQLFCNDTLGNIYESELITFTVSTSSSTTPSESDDDNSSSTITLEMNLFMIILIIIIISMIISIGAVYIIRNKSEKTTLMTQETGPTPYSSDIKAAVISAPHGGSKADLPKRKTYITKPEDVKDSTHYKKLKTHAEMATSAVPLSEVEKKEVEKTESEMDVEKQKFICVVHKGPIVGPNYICPKCETFYCLKCATSLKEKGEKCWVCEKEFII